MTRIFTEGFEMGDVLGITLGNSELVGFGRTGNYSFRPTGGTGYIVIDELSEVYVRFAYRQTSGGANGNFVRFYKGATVIGGFGLNSSGYPTATVNNVVVATSVVSPCNAASNWYLVEMYYKMDDSGQIIIKVDGIVHINYSGDTKPGADTTFDRIGYSEYGGGTAYDDLALNDTNGIIDNLWCGDGHIELLRANDNGDTNDWDGSDGDKVNNYLLVDDFPKDDDTTYVKSTITQQDMYNVGDYSPAGKIPTRIYAECRARDATAGAGAIKIGYKHGGTVYLSDARLLSSSYQRVVGSDALLDPSDSTIWSEADLDAIQFVVECSSSSSSSTTSSSSSTEIP